MQRALVKAAPTRRFSTATANLPCTCGSAPAPHLARSRRSGTIGHRRTLSTINPAEIKHFASLAATWWDEAGEFNVLQRMNKVRVQFLRDRLSEGGLLELPDPVHILKGMRVLDVGCGGGLFAERLARLGGRTLAIDASEENVQTATLHASQDPHLLSLLESGQLEYRASAVETLGKPLDGQEGDSSEMPPEQFDVVCAMEVLEHVSDPQGFLRRLAELTKPGGHMILSTIARTPLARALAIGLAESPLVRLAPAGSHTYSKFILPSELENFVRNELGWGSAQAAASTVQGHRSGHLTPVQKSRNYKIEVRGTTYLPWQGEWTLLRRDDGSALSTLSKSVNYFFGARKPLNIR